MIFKMLNASRRSLIAIFGASLGGASSTLAQGSARMGFLSGGAIVGRHITLDILVEALATFGWRQGDNLHVEGRWADGDASLLPKFASELAALSPNVLVATGATETKALQSVTSTISIIFLQVSADPVTSGFVKRISRPGGNITGFMQGPQFLWGKRLEILTELLGRRPLRLAWLGNPENTNSQANWVDAQEAAAKFGSDIVRLEVRSAGDLGPAFRSLTERDALLVQYDFLLSAVSQRIAALAAQERIPAVYENRQHVLAGGLVSYGGDLRENYRQGATYVHRILKGTATPAELPVVQASRFELVVNLTAAKGLGLTVPETLIARADEVIE